MLKFNKNRAYLIVLLLLTMVTIKCKNHYYKGTENNKITRILPIDNQGVSYLWVKLDKTTINEKHPILSNATFSCNGNYFYEVVNRDFGLPGTNLVFKQGNKTMEIQISLPNYDYIPNAKYGKIDSLSFVKGVYRCDAMVDTNTIDKQITSLRKELKRIAAKCKDNVSHVTYLKADSSASNILDQLSEKDFSIFKLSDFDNCIKY